ncbi:NAD-dependent protein deacetylase [bioreactor metagenome]|uniref:NAD-dependent protein deacetylase n=1 Tax=bioreactor metagenome TaxID=1076179 RepID=A0A645EYI2_9ZZZZ
MIRAVVIVMHDKIAELKELISKSRRIVFFTGAGLSTESAIPDFRGSAGLNKEKTPYPLEVMLSHSFFVQHPDEFYAFYHQHMLYPQAQPNAAHLKIAELERQGQVLAVITQNIDDLHTKAGSKRVYELHGNVNRNYCVRCHHFYDLAAIVKQPGIPYCSCGGIIKPDVVLYEEALDEKTLLAAVQAIRSADCLIVVGSSLSVYPASGLLRYFQGKHLVIINRDPTDYDQFAEIVLHESAGFVLTQV